MTGTGEPQTGQLAGAPSADLLGPDPASDPLAWYQPPELRGDVLTAATPDVSARWRAFAGGLMQQAQGDISRLQDYLDRHVDDLGLAYRMTGDDQERAWPLNPMPILIGADEWAGIEAGLVQRADLLESVIADIYGPQQLVRDQHLPAAVVAGSANFAQRMVGMTPPGGHHLYICAFDLARGPGGEWRVLADRVRLPVGIGFALENRIAMKRAAGGQFGAIGARRQAEFFDALRHGIAAACHRADPRIGLLTPGRFNQSYPEQALLARHLGFPLVEGRDLVVDDGKLFVRTIAGLKRIDALWRWIGTRDIDPMNFDARSQIGVPNLIAAADQGLVIANWPGAGVIESRAFAAFLPKLSKVLTGEALRLPNVATWWCGGPRERDHVLAAIDRLVISSAFNRAVPGLGDGHTRVGASLSEAERAELLGGIAQRPFDYAAQEVIRLSTTPALIGSRFEPRGFTLRAFLARDGDGRWRALPGGFGRISEHGDLRTSLMGLGDISADVCVVDPSRPTAVTPSLPPKPIDAQGVSRQAGLLPSHTADNLYWLGRYGERAAQTVRVVRALIDQGMAMGTRGSADTTAARLVSLLAQLGAIPPASDSTRIQSLCAIALDDGSQNGSLRALIGSARQIALLLRDHLSRDLWRAVRRAMPGFAADDLETMAQVCDRMVERFAALSGLVSTGMSRGAAWRFLELGVAIERASMGLQAAQALVPGSASADDLTALLDLGDSQAFYRSRYLDMPRIVPVFDMVLLDPAQPRSLSFQAATIADHLQALPALRKDGMPERALQLARRLQARLAGMEARQLDQATLSALRGDLGALSDAISASYFLQQHAPETSGLTIGA